jgi:hypothetical protein
LSSRQNGLRLFRTVPPRRVAAAPAKNIENNPMQSSRRRPQTLGLDRNLDMSGKSAAQLHNPDIRWTTTRATQARSCSAWLARRAEVAKNAGRSKPAVQTLPFKT